MPIIDAMILFDLAVMSMTLIEKLESRTLPSGDAAPRVLFIRGADRSGGFLEATNDAQRTAQLADINDASTANPNRGWNELRLALVGAGFAVEQIAEPLEPGAPGGGQTSGSPLPLNTMNLAQYSVIVFGSNNAIYTQPQVDALEAYVRNGGATLFISDANFGSDWADAPNSDQQFLDRFGLGVHQDNGTYSLTRAGGDFLVAGHPILTGVNTFDGEGVSPLFVKQQRDDVMTSVLVRAKQNVRLNAPPLGNQRIGTTRAANAGDASLLVALAGTGRIAGHFDRNTFFNLNGAGTNINRFENRQYAINLFNWLARRNADNVPPTTQQTRMNVEWDHRFEITWTKDVGATLNAADLVVRNASGAIVSGNAYTVESVTQSGQTRSAIRFSPRLSDGNYTISVRAGAVADAAGNVNLSALSLPFHILTGDVDRDRDVDFADLLTLAQNYGQSGRSFVQGNLNYSPAGEVDFADLLLLAQRFGTSLLQNAPTPIRRTPKSQALLES
jgi:hypothetical protein